MSRDPLSDFHPAVAGWFRSRFPAPTEAQARAWAVTSRHRNALIAAPTGSGKTLAAFLSAINDLVVEGLSNGLSDEVHVLYVSPLKALSNDIQKNLQEPLAGIRDQLLEMGVDDVPIRDAVRTGDTSAFERNRMRRTPPHILVTTPESLFILLTSDSGRAMLKSVRSVIVDELHSVAGSKRGSHLMLSLERLDALCGKPPVRVGLSATVKPLEAMARFLVGARGEAAEIVDTGHVRERDLALEVPRSPLEAVMANEVWDELYERLAELIQAHRTTLIFVNNRRLAERATRHLAERVGAENVATHHGSLSKEHRLKAETRLKEGRAPRFGRHLLARARHRHRRHRPRLPDGFAAIDLGAPPARRPRGPCRRRDRRRAGCSRCRSTTSSSAPPSSTASGAASSTASACRRSLWTYSPSRSWPKSPAANGAWTSCSRHSAVRSRTRTSPRRNSSRSCRCSPRATRRGAAGARPTCTTIR